MARVTETHARASALFKALRRSQHPRSHERPPADAALGGASPEQMCGISEGRCSCTFLLYGRPGCSNFAFDLWSYGDSNPRPLACHHQAGSPAASIAAGQRPRSYARVRLCPHGLRYFHAVLQAGRQPGPRAPRRAGADAEVAGSRRDARKALSDFTDAVVTTPPDQVDGGRATGTTVRSSTLAKSSGLQV